jgi:signal transduction histidine kinase
MVENKKVERDLFESERNFRLLVNNLLMIISGNLHMIKKEVTSEKSSRALHSIDIAAQRAASLTRQLLTFARRQSVQPQPIVILKRLNAMRDLLNSGLGGSVTLAVETARTSGQSTSIRPNLKPPW